MKNVEQIKEKIAKSAEKSGRKYNDITVVCATKTRDIDTVEGILRHGFCAAGENRVQELLSKFRAVEGLEWQFIGQLQTNKVKFIVDKVSLIQSADRLSLVREIDKECAKIGKVMPVLAEADFARTEGRGGVAADGALIDFVNEISAFKNVKVCGLMTILPVKEDRQLLANYCKEMNALFERAKAECPEAEMRYLSMGMSDDFEVAIENGANMIRLGRILFGGRN